MDHLANFLAFYSGLLRHQRCFQRWRRVDGRDVQVPGGQGDGPREADDCQVGLRTLGLGFHSIALYIITLRCISVTRGQAAVIHPLGGRVGVG